MIYKKKLEELGYVEVEDKQRLYQERYEQLSGDFINVIRLDNIIKVVFVERFYKHDALNTMGMMITKELFDVIQTIFNEWRLE